MHDKTTTKHTKNVWIFYQEILYLQSMLDADCGPGMLQRARLTLSMQSLPTSDDFEIPRINEKSMSVNSLASLASGKKSGA